MPYHPEEDDDGPPEWESWMEGPEARLAREEAAWQKQCELTVIGLLASLHPSEAWARLPRWSSQVFWHLPRFRGRPGGTS